MMKLSLFVSFLFAGSAAAFAPASQSRAAVTTLSESKADLEALGAGLNPVVGYWDPLGLAEGAFWGQSDDFTIGFLRHAEIKHGRVAMAAFVGYCVQSAWTFPWKMTLGGLDFPGTDLSPPEQWDALPFATKLQIILFVGFLEWYSELTPAEGSEEVGLVHYTKGGVPGKFPSFDGVPHPVPYNLYDPFNYAKSRTAEENERLLLVEINNGRLAMLSIIAFLSAQAIPGSVPGLVGIVKPYSGDVMAPFAGDFSIMANLQDPLS